MTPNPLNTYIETVRSESPSTPAMMDESSIFVLLSDITSQHLLSYEELIEASISSVFVYDIPEDKKEFNIETVRQCIIDIELMPYSGKHTYILRHFDTATLPAQNALLKILEECPPYAVILLEVDNPNSVLETIRSRVIDLTLMQQRGILSSQGGEIIELYRAGKHNEVASILYDMRCSSDEAILILRGVYPYLSEIDMARCDYAIESLAATHENPRLILDIFFL